MTEINPTQVRRPWRSTLRTVFQALLALCVLFPLLVDQTGLTVADAPWLAVPLAVAAAAARIMALPQVEEFLRDHLSFLAAAPPLKNESVSGNEESSLLYPKVNHLGEEIVANIESRRAQEPRRLFQPGSDADGFGGDAPEPASDTPKNDYGY